MGAGHHLNRVQNRMRERERVPVRVRKMEQELWVPILKNVIYPVRIKAKARNMSIMYVTTVYFFGVEKKKE